MQTLTFLLSGTLLAATPLLIAALGELVVEKSGILNLSIEGMMAFGAVIGFIVVSTTGSYWLAIVVGGLAGSALSVVFAAVVLVTLGNQVATGIAVGILGLGLSALIGQPFESSTVAPMAKVAIPLLSDLPIVGRGLFNHPAIVYLAPLLALSVWFMLMKSKIGLIIRAVGESPESAHAIGYDVNMVRFACILFGGFLAGVAGAFISIASTTLWANGLIAGRGWIVVALVVFATWRSGRIVIGAYLFGAATIGELLVQSFGISVPSQLLTSVPFIATIIAIVLLSMDGRSIRLNAPVSLGQVYRVTH